jgi:putative thioredoxin
VSKDVYVFEVNQKSFEQTILFNSHKIPVIVQFMGVWSAPCMAMDLVFSSLAKEFAEQFVFAKVDIDEQPELGKQYKIENVPTLLVFRDGKQIRSEVGELKESDARALLKELGIFNQADLMREQAREKHLGGDTAGAILQLTDAIKAEPSNTRVAMDMVQIFIDIGEIEQAGSLYERLPKSARDTDMGMALNRQLTFARLAADTPDIETLQNRLASNADDADAHFDLALRMITLHQYREAADHLFAILQKQDNYKDGAAREMIITISNMMASVDNELAQDIRRRLANLLTA